MRCTLAVVTAILAAACAHPVPAPASASSRASSRASPQAASPLVPDAARPLAGTAEAFQKGCDDDVQRARDAVAWLKSMPAPRAPEAALSAYDDAMTLLDDADARAALGANIHPDARFRQAAETCEQAVERERGEVSRDRGVYDALASLDLSAQDAATRRWVGLLLRDFRRAGVDRDDTTRARAQALDAELVRLGQAFNEHLREDERFVDVTPEELDGLPEDFVRAHPPGPDGRVRISTNTPDLAPFLMYARSARAREALWRENLQRGYPENQDTLARLLQTRHARATLLGYPSWADYVTEDLMVRSPRVAGDFLERLATTSGARARAEYATLLERKRQEVPDALRVDPWDQAYLEERVRAEAYAFDSQALRPYFEYTRVKQGVLDLTAHLFGLTYRRVPDAPVWHPDVEAYDVYEGTARVGRFYLDMYPRPDKYKGAAQWDLATGRAGRSLPEGVLTCNFPRPGGPGAPPALLRHGDVKAFFHEFGHLLHQLLGSRARWAGLSGTRTERDFVEVPSQVLEEWARRPESLQTFARHYQTGAPVPADLVDRMRRASDFGKGLWVRQQLFFAALDLRLHDGDPRGLDPVAVEKALQEKYTPFAFVDGSHFLLSLAHLEDYSATLYTYLWSLVIAQDLFTPFVREGLMNPATALRYRHAVLAPEGLVDAAQRVRDFLGRDTGDAAFTRWLDGR